MKQGKTIQELAAEIARQAANARDYVADVSAVAMKVNEEQPDRTGPTGTEIAIGDMAPLKINDHAHGQIAQHLKIPQQYYDRLRAEQPELLATSVNTLLHAKDEKRMLRVLDNRLRAFVSDRFRPGLSNLGLAESVLPILSELGVLVISCEITERRLYLKVVDKRIEKDVPTGRRMGDGSHVFFDTLSPALVLSNSEVGSGSFSVETGVWTHLCTNLAVASQRSMKKYHVGSRADIGEEMYALLTDDTRRKTDDAIFAQVADVVRGAFDAARFDAMAAEVGKLAAMPITGDAVKVVEVTSKLLGINEGEQSSILKHLIAGGDLTAYGVHSAVTRASADVADYDRASDFERMGGKLIELPANQWQEVLKAA